MAVDRKSSALEEAPPTVDETQDRDRDALRRQEGKAKGQESSSFHTRQDEADAGKENAKVLYSCLLEKHRRAFAIHGEVYGPRARVAGGDSTGP